MSIKWLMGHVRGSGSGVTPGTSVWVNRHMDKQLSDKHRDRDNIDKLIQ